jgi:hypothetical protein
MPRELPRLKDSEREAMMLCRSLIGAVVLSALGIPSGDAQAFDDAKYPDWTGQWERFVVRGLPGQPSFDQTKPWGFGQQAPLTPEYQKVLEDSMADQAKGGLGNYHTPRCLAAGMPLMMIAFRPLEFIVTPVTTYILIGRWIDEDGDGRFDVLEVETRGPFKGPRAYDASGLPLHFDNQSIFKERFRRDKADPNVFHDEITVIDHALTQPWIVDKRYVRNPNPRPDWPEYYCGEYNAQIVLGKDNYFLSWDGLLMPARKDQPPPDLKYFNRSRRDGIQ